MITDISAGTRIYLERVPNAHIAYIGMSGSGKTYAICRHIEELMALNHGVLICDWSGSYTDRELRKSEFSVKKENIQMIDLSKQKVSFRLLQRDSEDADHICSLAENVLGLSGALQKKILHRAVTEAGREGKLSFAKVQEYLEKMMEEEECDENYEKARRISKVMDRWQMLADKEFLDLWGSDGIAPDTKKLVILQMFSMPHEKRKACMTSILWCLWMLAEKGDRSFRTLVLDEAQYINFSADIPSRMMREGRKFDLSLILSTQFTAGLKKDEMATIFQAGNVFYFHPDIANLRETANRIQPSKAVEWMEILQNLSVGQAVLCGHYTVNGNLKEQCAPIITTFRTNRLMMGLKI